MFISPIYTIQLDSCTCNQDCFWINTLFTQCVKITTNLVSCKIIQLFIASITNYKSCVHCFSYSGPCMLVSWARRYAYIISVTWYSTCTSCTVYMVMPRWVEPRRHMVVVACVCVCVCLYVFCMHFSANG